MSSGSPSKTSERGVNPGGTSTGPGKDSFTTAVHPATNDCSCPHGIATLLVEWYVSNGRVFPWRQTTDPYQVLMAVFMLQRTGVSQVMNVYERFVSRYRDLRAIVDGDDQELADILRPLGRVDRWPVLKKLAESILEEYGGRVPDDLESLDALPGIGQYSARALLCLAFGRPRIMLDPNSYRVLSRACGFATDKSRPHTDRLMIERLDALVPDGAAQAFNLALLDVGSTICRAKRPQHVCCPLMEVCWFRAEAETI